MTRRLDVERNTDRTVRVLREANVAPDLVLVEDDAVLSWDETAVRVVVYGDAVGRNVRATAGDVPLWAVNLWDLVDRADVLTSVLRAAVATARATEGKAS